MATETVASDHHSATSEKEVQSEVKEMEAETVAPSPVKESVAAPEESACLVASPSTESQGKIEDKRVEPPPVAEAIERKTEDIVNKEVELPPKAEEMKTEDAPIPEPSADKVERELEEKIEKEVLPEEVVETIVAKDVTEAECKVEEVSPAAPIVEEKPSEESGIIEAEPVGIVDVKTQTLPREEESGATENTTTHVEEKEVGCYPTEEGGEKTGEEKETPAKEAIEVKERVSEAEKIEAKTDENIVVTEEKIQCPSTELEEKVVKEEVTDRDTKLVAENAKTEADHKEASEETEKVEAVEKLKETAQSFDEPVENPECTKEIEDTKKAEDVPVKTQKQSIVKMVKQSLVKAKKAITGKSQSPKTPASEPKDDGNKQD